MQETGKIEQQERIYIIQPIFDDTYPVWEKETISLIESAGASHAGTIRQKIREVNPATVIGPGKLAELSARLEGLDVTVLYNGDLSPTQTLNISRALGDKKVIDRTTLILDIFAKNAKTNEGKLQVELAMLQYMYPRLKGKGAALSRLGGGIGTRGPGETKLETDRRRIRQRIAYLKTRLASLKNTRDLIDKRRSKENITRISLIGYTNTGKSTLLNALTEADVYAENKLFATLDPTSRYLFIDKTPFLLTDTVGFLQNLPHNLISAFHSTLESALQCDLALIVCDAAGDYEMQLQTTRQTLQELGCTAPCLIVMNKSEKIENFDGYPPKSIFISAKQKTGLEQLKGEILRSFRENYLETTLHIPYNRMHEYSGVKRYLTECAYSYFDDHADISVRIPRIYQKKLTPFLGQEEGQTAEKDEQE